MNYKKEAELIYEQRKEKEKQKEIEKIMVELKMKEEPITEPQKKSIRLIEQFVGIKFEGTNKFDAKEFISDNIEESKKIMREYNFERDVSQAVLSTMF